MSDVKLRKKLQDENLFYLVYEQQKDAYYDWFLFENYQNLPLLEKYYFKIMQEELVDFFRNKEYSRVKFQTDLLILYNVCFNGDVIDIKSSKMLSELYIQIRYHDLYETIDSFRNQVGLYAVENLKKNVLEIPSSLFDKKTNQLLDELKNKCCPQESKETLLKEILNLCIFTEYNKAKKRVIRETALIESAQKLIEQQEEM